MLPPIPAARDFPGSPWQKPPLHSMGDAVRGRHDQVSVPVLCTATGERRATTGTRSPRSRRHPKRPPRTAARGTPSRFYSSLHPWQWRFRFAVPVSPRSRGAAIGPILARPTGLLAYVTHTLVTRDRRASEKLQLHLGPPDRIVQFERGFDLWRINYYGEQCYMLRNNQFVKTIPCVSLQSQHQGFGNQIPDRLRTSESKFMPPFLIDTPVLGNPKWLQLYPLHPQRAPRFVSPYLYRLEDGRLLGPIPWLSR